MAAIGCVVLAGCGSNKTVTSPKTLSVPGNAVAVVGHDVVTKAQVAGLLKAITASDAQEGETVPKQGTPAYPSLQDQAVAYLVDEAMYGQQAKHMGINVTAKQVAAAITAIRNRTFSGSEKKLQAEMKADGLSQAELQQQERLTLIEKRIEEKLNATLKVTDGEAKAYYVKHKSSYLTADSRTVRQILVKTKGLAQRLYNELRAGANFASLAKKYSIDTTTAKNGGKLTISRGETVPNFDNAAFALRTGAVSKPIHSRYGWHVIKALTPVKKGTLSSFVKEQASIRATLLKTEETAVIKAWTKHTAATFCAGKVTYNPDYKPTTAANDPCSESATGATSTTSGS